MKEELLRRRMSQPSERITNASIGTGFPLALQTSPLRGVRHTMKFTETSKLWADYLKHISTLSTGSIVIIATFLEKIFSNSEWKWLVVVSLIGFLCSVLFSLVSFTSISLSHIFWEDGGEPKDWIQAMGFYSTFATWLSFGIALATFTAFVIKNIV